MATDWPTSFRKGSVIELKNISKAFAQQVVIPDLSLFVPEGEVHVLLGPSGCGKTTILRTISGLTQPDSGSVFIKNTDLSSMGNRQISRIVGYMVQDGGLFPHMSVRENIMLPIKIHGLSLSEVMESDSDRLDDLKYYLDLVELNPNVLKKYPRQLSGGQKQRVALLRGLILRQDVLLLDEPLSALDPVVRLKLQIQLRKIFKTLNKTVVLVTHDINEASYLADQISLLRRGKIIQQGPFKELYRSPKDEFVEEFFSSQTPLEI